MATKLRNLKIELQQLEACKDHLPQIDWNNPSVKLLTNMGLIEVSTAFEHSVANAMGTTVVSEDTNDLANGDDAKLSSVRLHSKGKRYSAPIMKVHNKTGNLIVLVGESKKKKDYLFKIPHEAYKHIKRTSNIDIPFYHDGTPRRSNKWWRFLINESNQHPIGSYPNQA